MIFSIGCSASRRDQLEKAEELAINQRSQLARHLFIQVLKDSRRKDDLRVRALEGLLSVTAYQLHQYQEALEVLDILIKDFEMDPLYKPKVPEWRAQAASIAREHLDEPIKAQEYLAPLKTKENLPVGVLSEMGDTALALGEYGEAEIYFLQVWEDAKKESRCSEMRSSQLNLMHVFQLTRRCDRALEWAEKPLPDSCVKDVLSILSEKAICYEMMGEVSKAIDILEAAQLEQPENKRISALIQSIRHREKRKAIR